MSSNLINITFGGLGALIAIYGFKKLHHDDRPEYYNYNQE